MCLIIKRNPGFEMPFESFKSAVITNPDGYGFSYPYNGKLITVRSPDKPDVDKLYRIFNEDLKDRDLLIHLRYRTAGEVDLRNAHPFPILERKTDGVDLRMAHNGTIHSFKDSKTKNQSDTRRFVLEYVRPLFKRLIRGMSPDELMADSFVQSILSRAIPSSSVLVFMDDEGRSMIVNPTGNGGKQEDGWYYSNVYSFNRDHRSKSDIPFQSPYGQIGQTRKHSTTTSSTSVFSSPMPQGTTTLEKFTKKHHLKVDDLFNLSDKTISAMVGLYHEDAELLIKELLALVKSYKTKSEFYLKQRNELKEKLN